MAACSEHGCTRPVLARRMCPTHYAVWRKRNPHLVNRRPTVPAKETRGPFRGCWEWTGGKTTRGYGVVKVDGVKKLVHRAVFEAIEGELDESLEVCHKCDNPSCYRPAHLFAATHRENMLDMQRKRRSGKIKLTDDQVRSVYEARLEGESYATIGARLGVANTCIMAIVHGRTWVDMFSDAERAEMRGGSAAA